MFVYSRSHCVQKARGKTLYSILSRIHKIHKKYAQNLGLVTTISEASLGFPGPPLFTAVTLNSYSWPSSRSGTVPLVQFPGTVAAFSQGLKEKIINMIMKMLIR